MTTTQKKQTKVGDKIRITKERSDKHIGEVGTVVSIVDGFTIIKVDFPTDKGFKMSSVFDDDDWEMAENTLHTLQEGDILINEDDEAAKVLAVIRPGLYVLSAIYNLEHSGQIFTAKELEDNGYTIKQETEAVVERTVVELEQALKLKPGTLRVKADEAA